MFIENITSHTAHDPESLPGRSGGGRMAPIIFSEKHATFLLNLTPIIMEKKKVKISYACSIKWDSMQSIDAKSKFCDSCKIKVQDFTKDTELNTSGIHCGHFRADQVESFNRTFSFNTHQVLTFSLFSLLGLSLSTTAQNVPVEIPTKTVTAELKKDFKLDGQVKHGESNQAIQGVTIIISNSLERLYKTETDSTGKFSIELLGYSVLHGDLKVMFIKEGFNTSSINSKDVSKGSSIVEISIIPDSKSEIIQILTVRGGTSGTVAISADSLSGSFDNDALKTSYRQ